MRRPAVFARFLLCQRFSQALFQSERIALRPSAYYEASPTLDGADAFTFDILALPQRAVAGEIALRVGDNAALFYLGHIGYHVDAPYRGHGYAAESCALHWPFARAFGMRSLCVTTDVDNVPSIRTCERAGCVYECTVPVPAWCRTRFDLPDRKKRFVLPVL